jgi:hypothetical protein
MPTGLRWMGFLSPVLHILNFIVYCIKKTIHCDKIAVIMSKMLLGLRDKIKEEEDVHSLTN